MVNPAILRFSGRVPGRVARKLRIEVEGGLYHVNARRDDRRDIFHSKSDHLKFLELLGKKKIRSAFYLYAYCLMTNHIHLLIERQAETVGRVMQRVLTGYSQYYNRKYKHVGHVFQGRHESILCQSDGYLAELVRYIHLNPVRRGNRCQVCDSAIFVRRVFPASPSAFRRSPRRVRFLAVYSSGRRGRRGRFFRR